MRFSVLAANILAGAVALAAAMPAADPEQQTGLCCCCDISTKTINCMVGPLALQCNCLAVQCPADAPTVWKSVGSLPPPPAPTTYTPPPPPPPPPATTSSAYSSPPAPSPPPPVIETECCCCDPALEAITCRANDGQDVCVCPLVFCREGLPTITLRDPLPTPTPKPLPSPIDDDDHHHHHHHHGDGHGGQYDHTKETVDCCCCNSSLQANVCQKVNADDGCFCAAVVCPPGAPTYWRAEEHTSHVAHSPPICGDCGY